MEASFSFCRKLFEVRVIRLFKGVRTSILSLKNKYKITQYIFVEKENGREQVVCKTEA